MEELWNILSFQWNIIFVLTANNFFHTGFISPKRMNHLILVIMHIGLTSSFWLTVSVTQTIPSLFLINRTTRPWDVFWRSLGFPAGIMSNLDVVQDPSSLSWRMWILFSSRSLETGAQTHRLRYTQPTCQWRQWSSWLIYAIRWEIIITHKQYNSHPNLW